MTDETNLNNIPKSFLDYLRVIVFDNVDFYEISTKDIIQMWNDTENKEAFKDDEVAQMKKIVKKINGIKIDVRSEKCLYITIKDWTIYIDNSTNEKIIDVWNDKKDITVQELH